MNESSLKRSWSKPSDQMDEWLDSQGKYRKHTAKDSTCLFRAVSEQVFLTQSVHSQVRTQVIDYIARHKELFQKFTNIPIDEYIGKMRNPKECGGKLEMEAMSLMYKIDFMVYEELGQPIEPVTHNGYRNKIMLCHFPERHYDSVYTTEYIKVAAFCQSTVYDMLYKKVFQLVEVDYAVYKMLHEKHRDQVPFVGNDFALRLEMRETILNVKELLDSGITPFPYKVAKSLDPDVYRNVEYDTWNEFRKGLRYGFCTWNCRDVQIGVKCLVKHNGTSYHGHVQDMQPNRGPVTVFIEELGERVNVPYDTLELLPAPPPLSSSSPSQKAPAKATLTLKLPTQFIEGFIAKKSKILKSKHKDCSEKSKARDSKDYCLSRTPSGGEHEFNPENYFDNRILPQRQHQDDDVMNCGNIKMIMDGLGNLQQPGTRQYPDEEVQFMGYPQQVTAVPSIQPISMNPPIPPQTLPLPPPEPSSFQYFVPSPIPMNLMAPKSINADGTEIPHADVTPMRFFYNVGVDHIRMNCMVRPTQPYYMNHSLVSPGYVTVDAPQPLNPACDPATIVSIPVKRPTSIYEGAPLMSQSDVGPSSVAMGGAPVQPMYYPPAMPQPPPVTPQPVEMETYCYQVPYLDYQVYDYSPAYPNPPHVFSTPYIPPEQIYYQPFPVQQAPSHSQTTSIIASHATTPVVPQNISEIQEFA